MLQRLTRGRLPEVAGVDVPLAAAARAALLAALVQGVAAVALVWSVHEAIDTKALGGGVLLGVALAALARGLGPALGRRPEAVAERYAADLRVALLARSAGLPGNRQGSGAAVAALTLGVDAVGRVLGELLPATISAAVAALVATAVLLVLDPGSALIAWLPLLAMPLVAARVSRRNGPLLAAAWRRVASLSSRFTETIRVLPTLRATGGLGRAVDELDAASGALEESTAAAMRAALAANLALDFLAGLSIGLVAMGLGFRLMDGRVLLATAVAVLVAVPELTGPVRRLGASAHAAREATVAAEQLSAVAAAAALATTRVAGPTRGSRVEVEAASCRYGERRLGPWSFTLAPGDALVLRGPSGSGKSTLLGLLAGATATDGGRCTVDGLAPGVSGTVLVPARPSILSTSLAGNVDLGRGRDEAELASALELVGLGELLARLPAGLATPLGQGGRPLSAGEAQRIGLARAVVASPSLLLLDEPTTHLDATTAEELQATLGPWLAGRTVIVAAHGPSLLPTGTPELELLAEVLP